MDANKELEMTNEAEAVQSTDEMGFQGEPYKSGSVTYIDSREVAKMVEKTTRSCAETFVGTLHNSQNPILASLTFS